MEKRNIELTLETATRWYNGADTELKALALETFPELEKKELPKSWEELETISGVYVNPWSELDKVENPYRPISNNQNVFATKEQAEASIALAQLSQLREVYRNGWVPNWKDNNEKYAIIFHKDKIIKDLAFIYCHFLTFQDKETRDLFLENFHELILKAKPLMQ